MKRPSLSLAMIVKNEERNLPLLLESVKDCVDEIHITDTGSTDGTVEIAKKGGAQVHHFDWVDDFGAARNKSFEPVKTDFVFWLDGDDVLKNKEHFNLFTENAMGLADYWLAPYHYTTDKNTGQPLCTFIRERVFRTSKAMRWKYFVHEGVQPISPYGQVKCQFINTWSVVHMRTDEDLKADKSRNIKLFEKNQNSLDARMKYYYGKELFENGHHVDACRWLLDSAADPALELHDRILCLQYAAHAFFACNQYERSVQIAHNGLQLAPQRAEFYNQIGDCYLRMGKLMEAIPMYSAAKACSHVDGSNAPSPIFAHPDAYGVYPKNQLARLFVHVGKTDEAKKEAAEAHAINGNVESKQILEEIERVTKLTMLPKDVKEVEDIVITCPPHAVYDWDADLMKEKGCGGSETAAIYLAHWMHKLSGRPVKIFNVRAQDKVCDGVEYIDNKKIHEYFSQNKPFLHIAWRHNIKLTDAPTFLWCHDLITQGAENSNTYKKVLALTPFHKRYLRTMQGVEEDKILVVRNGINPDRFRDTKEVKKNSNKIVFPSSPDRGLDRAMRVMDKVRLKYPRAELHVFYGLENLYKYGLKDLADKLKSMMDERKEWVHYHGFTQQDVLAQHLKESVVWLHPCDFIETSCITAMEMLCAGVYPVTRKLGGLMDTLAKAEQDGMATMLEHDCITEVEYEAYVAATLDALDNKKWEKVSVNPDDYSWESVAREFLDLLPKHR